MHGSKLVILSLFILFAFSFTTQAQVVNKANYFGVESATSDGRITYIIKNPTAQDIVFDTVTHGMAISAQTVRPANQKELSISWIADKGLISSYSLMTDENILDPIYEQKNVPTINYTEQYKDVKDVDKNTLTVTYADGTTEDVDKSLVITYDLKAMTVTYYADNGIIAGYRNITRQIPFDSKTFVALCIVWTCLLSCSMFQRNKVSRCRLHPLLSCCLRRSPVLLCS